MAEQSGYTAVFASAAIEFFAGLAKRRQRKVLDRARELTEDPFLVPDFRSTDSSGREISHLMVDDFIFDFWVDHAVKQVVITAIDHVA